MTTANYGQSEINQVLSQARFYNQEIGSHVMHAIDTNDFNYSVKLTNGMLKITWEELQDRNSLTEERKKSIAKRLKKNS
jgi:hypothetical protein